MVDLDSPHFFWRVSSVLANPSLCNAIIGAEPGLLFIGRSSLSQSFFRPRLFQSIVDFSPIYIQFPGELYFNCFGGIWWLHQVHQKLTCGSTWLARHLLARLGLPSNHARLDLPRLGIPSNHARLELPRLGIPSNYITYPADSL